MTGISGDAGAGTQTFAYDALGRLTASNGLATAKSYQYDLDGNRTRKVEGTVTTTYTFDRTDQLLAQGGLSFTYDPYGNMTAKVSLLSTLTTYTYDSASRLTKITPAAGAGSSATFTLDALGRTRTRTLDGPGTTETNAYLGTSGTALEVSSVTGGVTTTARSLLDLDATRLAIRPGGGSTSWTLFDQLGSLVGLESGTNTVTDAWRYDGYGETLATAGPIAAGGTNPWRFRGLVDVSPTSDALYDMGARFYAPSVGSFTQLDTYPGSAADPASMNRYLYAEANPSSLIDPTGHMTNQNQLCNPGWDYCGENATPTYNHSHPDTTKPRNGGGCGTSCGSSSTKPSGGGNVDTSWTSPRPPTVWVDIPTGPVNLSSLSFASEDWYRLTDWCTNGGAKFTGQACEYARTGVGGPDGDHLMAVLLSMIAQMPPGIGDVYQAIVINSGHDPISGYDLSWQERQDGAMAAVVSLGLIPTTAVVKGERWIDNLDSMPLGGPGRWVEESVGNAAARAYQSRATGVAEGWSYRVESAAGSHRFDGFSRVDGSLALVEAKSDYSFLMRTDGSSLQSWAQPTFREDVASTRTHLQIAGGMPIVYAVGNQGTAAYWQAVLDVAGASPQSARIVLAP